VNFKIENTSSSELDQILELNQQALPAVSSVTKKEMEHFLSIVDYFKSLIIDQRVVGFLIALTPGKDYHSVNYQWFEHKYKSFMYVDRIVITPTHQGKGLGTTFYNDLSKSTDQTITKITCEVNLKPTNEESMLFHKKYGFEQVDTQFTESGKKEVSLMKLSI
jgi:predicted GNAT superfamily acetyltransferase|tara:strand:- start:2912 stop:3400 length:489 start_codon:yes stop_codon:yes gene_type:complete